MAVTLTEAAAGEVKRIMESQQVEPNTVLSHGGCGRRVQRSAVFARLRYRIRSQGRCPFRKARGIAGDVQEICPPPGRHHDRLSGRPLGARILHRESDLRARRRVSGLRGALGRAESVAASRKRETPETGQRETSSGVAASLEAAAKSLVERKGFEPSTPALRSVFLGISQTDLKLEQIAVYTHRYSSASTCKRSQYFAGKTGTSQTRGVERGSTRKQAAGLFSLLPLPVPRIGTKGFVGVVVGVASERLAEPRQP